MSPVQVAPSLADQVYDALVDEICDGRLAPGTHLRQEQLAGRLGVSRQPIQQAMTLLKADGMLEELGRRGLFVTRLDCTRMRQHYGVRAALDGYAARGAAGRAAADPAFAVAARDEVAAILDAGRDAVAAGTAAEQIRLDEALHQLIYAWSGNPMIGSSAAPHWRFLRRAMGDVLRQARTPTEIWTQHAAIADAILAGDAAAAERLALGHVEDAAELLASVLDDDTATCASARPDPRAAGGRGRGR